MTQPASLAVGALAVALAAAGAGYWLGHRGSGSERAMDSAVTSGVAKESGPSGTAERKPLYYRNPMGLPDTSPVPKKDPMGMDYVPVYADGEDGEPASASQVRISPDKVQQLGVRTQAAERRALVERVRAAGRIEPDERRLYTVTAKFEGYIDRLYVNVTGQPVGKGQPLFEVYSPELVSAQREYVIAAQGIETLGQASPQARAGMRQLAESSLQRLKNWDISEEQIRVLATSGEARRTLTFRSPFAGVVTEKRVQQGMRVMPGESLYQIADLSLVWVLADVFEQDVGQVKTGAAARVRINAYPGRQFEGRVTYVYPTLETETRTVPVRIELANPDRLLKPGMFAQVELSAPERGPAVTVPGSAVIDSGTRQIVLVQQGEGRFEPREVKLGSRGEDEIEVIDGVREGESVVVSANFLIDAESNLKAAVAGFGQSAQPSRPAAEAGHRALGVVDSLDAQAGTLMIRHEPIASLKWPAMTMEFAVANPSLLTAMTPGAAIEFDFVERQPGEWVITAVKPRALSKPSSRKRRPHPRRP